MYLRVKGGPWNGKIWASHEANSFTVHERMGAFVRAHRYQKVGPEGKSHWQYAGMF